MFNNHSEFCIFLWNIWNFIEGIFEGKADHWGLTLNVDIVYHGDYRDRDFQAEQVIVNGLVKRVHLDSNVVVVRREI